MKYIIKNKIISLGGSSTVRSEEGKDLYLVKGNIFTFTKKKRICDLNGTPLFIVRNKFFHILLPKVFLCDANGNKLLMLKKKSLFSFRQSFVILSLDGSNTQYAIDGDIIARHFDILENGMPLAHVRRNFNIVKDSFWLETDLEDRAPFLIAFVIAIDNYFDKLEDNNRGFSFGSSDN